MIDRPKRSNPIVRFVSLISKNLKKVISGIIISLATALFTYHYPLIVQKCSGDFPLPEITKLKADPQIIKIGEKSIISWDSRNAKDCSLEWREKELKKREVHSSGTREVEPVRHTVYNLVCTGYGGEKDLRSVRLSVIGNPPINNKYRPIMLVRRKLDCDTGYKNGQKRLDFNANFKDKRVVFGKTVEKIHEDELEVYLTPKLERSYGSGYNGLEEVNVWFSSSPRLVLQSTLVLHNLKIGQKSSFDCEIKDYCHDGWIFDGEISFEDCILFEHKK
jgi:hypothetical protein